MTQVVIANPVLNSPFVEPSRHFRFDDHGITNEIVEGRRSSGYFIPIAQPKKRGKQLQFDTEWTVDRYKESEFINNVRRRMGTRRGRSRHCTEALSVCQALCGDVASDLPSAYSRCFVRLISHRRTLPLSSSPVDNQTRSSVRGSDTIMGSAPLIVCPNDLSQLPNGVFDWHWKHLHQVRMARA